jgi:hypothetical protein
MNRKVNSNFHFDNYVAYSSLKLPKAYQVFHCISNYCMVKSIASLSTFGLIFIGLLRSLAAAPACFVGSTL